MSARSVAGPCVRWSSDERRQLPVTRDRDVPSTTRTDARFLFVVFFFLFFLLVLFLFLLVLDVLFVVAVLVVDEVLGLELLGRSGRPWRSSASSSSSSDSRSARLIHHRASTRPTTRKNAAVPLVERAQTDARVDHERDDQQRQQHDDRPGDRRCPCRVLRRRRRRAIRRRARGCLVVACTPGRPPARSAMPQMPIRPSTMPQPHAGPLDFDLAPDQRSAETEQHDRAGRIARRQRVRGPRRDPAPDRSERPGFGSTTNAPTTTSTTIAEVAVVALARRWTPQSRSRRASAVPSSLPAFSCVVPVPQPSNLLMTPCQLGPIAERPVRVRPWNRRRRGS